MIKKYLIVGVTLLTFLVNVLPAQAITPLPAGSTGVVVTATGTLTGNVTAMSGTVVDQDTTDGNSSSTITFATPSITGLTNSGRAIKLTAGTNLVGARMIICTDNASYFPVKKQGVDPRWNYDPVTGAPTGPSGADGAGLVGQSVSGYVAGLAFAISDNPGDNAAYTAWGYDVGTGTLTNATWMVDKGHFVSFNLDNAGNIVKSSDTTNKDCLSMYAPVGNPAGIDPTLDLNTDNDGLYPQYWDFDLYSTPSVPIANPGSATVLSEALCKNIGTIAFGFGAGDAANPNHYVCTVAKSSGAKVVIPLSKLPTAVAGTVDKYLYVPIAAVFAGVPAQTYTTTKLTIMFVQD